MPLINNTASYDEKEPTNIRLEKDVKEKLIEDADRSKTTMADIVNEILKKHYSKK
jgi:hypothetical protein